MQHQNYIPNSDAVKIEVAITRPNGEIVRLVCDSFDYIEIEKFTEPEYVPDFFNSAKQIPIQGPRVSKLNFSIDHPRTWTVYFPEQPSIDDGTVVEEA